MKLLVAAALLFGILTPSSASAWQISRSTSPVDDSPTVVLQQRADTDVSARYGRTHRPRLVIQCFENTTSLYIDYGFFLTTQSMRITTRIDSEKACQSTWRISTDYEAVGLWRGGQSIPFIKSMLGKEQLFVRLTPYGESTVSTTFTLDGLDDRIDAVAEACGWDASPPSAAASPSPAASPSVRVAQQRLQALGYTPGAADGMMGPRTRREITIFQKDEGLPQTGNLDAATLQRLEARTAGPDSLDRILDNVDRLGQ